MIRNLLKFVVILAAVCIVMGTGVAGLYGLWRGRIAAREAAARREAIQTVAPEGTTVDAAKPVAGEAGTPSAVYAARDASGETIAYVAAGAAQGYASTVRVMVGAKPTPQGLAIHKVVVTAQAETPGLGAQVAEQRSTYTLWQKLFGSDEAERVFNPFLERFEEKTAKAVPDIQAITAATITSNATKEAVQQALERIREAMEKR
jgi:RnfABCDGE-type electron transport complex G subunit